MAELDPRRGVFLRVAHKSVVFIVALYLQWCRCLETFRAEGRRGEEEGVLPQLHADCLQCVSLCSDDDDLFAAARFTDRYIRLVGQTPAPRN